MPQVNRKPVAVTELQPLPSGKTAAGWNVKAKSVNMSLPFYDSNVADLNAAVIPSLDIGGNYVITVSRLDSEGGVLASVSSTISIAQLPEDPVFTAPTAVSLAFA